MTIAAHSWALSASPTPASVPPVPSPVMKLQTLPPPWASNMQFCHPEQEAGELGSQVDPVWPNSA